MAIKIYVSLNYKASRDQSVFSSPFQHLCSRETAGDVKRSEAFITHSTFLWITNGLNKLGGDENINLEDNSIRKMKFFSSMSKDIVAEAHRNLYHNLSLSHFCLNIKMKTFATETFFFHRLTEQKYQALCVFIHKQL